ncbi:hypothetical protein [Nitrosospira lacus]|nr:hypothetical protein [Nitrosospira lacus]
MTDLQMAAARERIVFLTARRIAQHEKEDTMEALTAQGVTND